MPDLGRLEPGTLSVSPFEVLDGERYGDIVRGPRRFFQYRYGLRIIGEDYFGLDVQLPALELAYRITRTLDGGPAVEGREVMYVLPPESVRVLTLVPAEVGDVRELAGRDVWRCGDTAVPRQPHRPGSRGACACGRDGVDRRRPARPP